MVDASHFGPDENSFEDRRPASMIPRSWRAKHQAVRTLPDEMFSSGRQNFLRHSSYGGKGGIRITVSTAHLPNSAVLPSEQRVQSCNEEGIHARE